MGEPVLSPRASPSSVLPLARSDSANIVSLRAASDFASVTRAAMASACCT
jgi:hypothetical protein